MPIPTTLDLPRLEWFDVFRSMGEAIATAEKPFWGQAGAPLLTYHPTALWLPWSPDALASSFFGDDGWLTLDACQSGHADTPNLVFDPPMHFWNARAPHAPISKMVAQSVGKRPVLDLEGHCAFISINVCGIAANSPDEGMYVNLAPGSGAKWNGDDIRSGAWQSVLSGACGVVYGHNTVWQMYDVEHAKSMSSEIQDSADGSRPSDCAGSWCGGERELERGSERAWARIHRHPRVLLRNSPGGHEPPACARRPALVGGTRGLAGH